MEELKRIHAGEHRTWTSQPRVNSGGPGAVCVVGLGFHLGQIPSPVLAAVVSPSVSAAPCAHPGGGGSLGRENSIWARFGTQSALFCAHRAIM